MRIGIDARMIDNTGIGRYLRNLLIHLARIDTQNEYIISLNKENTQPVTQPNVQFVPLAISVPLYSLREQYWLPFEIRKRRLDLVHYPNFDIPLIQSSPYIVTIHDLIYYLYPDQCPSRLAHYYARFMLRYATKHAHIIITDSHYSKQDLMKYFQIPEHKIQVIFPAADISATHLPERPFHKAKYGIVQPYILYVGKHHPYKNILTLLRAYVADPEIYDRFQLVIAGKRDARRQELYETAERLDPRKKIIFTDFVEEAELFDLYREAHLFVFPSLYEGFGLPPLEAMACGVPVITSNAASLPEVVGDAAILFDPLNVRELAAAMRAVLTNPELWNSLHHKGLQRAQQFSWETAATQLLQIYQSTLRTYSIIQ
jgi:glycosyltransferase involved in cell wall biosynthesis